MREIITVNGTEVKEIKFLRSVMYGEGVFETFRYKGKLPSKIEAHYKRLSKGAEYLKIPKITYDDFIYYIQETVSKCEEKDLYIKTVLLPEGLLPYPIAPYGSKLMVIAKPYQEPKKKEISLTLSPFNVHSSDPLLRFKTTNYLRNIVAKRYAVEKGFDDVIFRNENNEVTETTNANIFWIKGRFLYTPSLDCGLLPGITRESVIQEAKKQGFVVVEGRFFYEDVKNADYVFVANALNGIIKVSKLDILAK